MLDQHVACTELRILEDVGDRVDRAADHAGVVEDAVDLGGVVHARPVGDDPLDLLLVVAARDVGAKRSSSASSGRSIASQSRRKTLSALAAITIHLLVARPEDVGRRDPLQIRPLRPADDSEPVVLGHRALEQREGRLHQRDVHDLAEPAADGVTPVERSEDSLGREHAGERVAEGDVHAGRRLAGKPLMWRIPPIASDTEANPARPA